MIGTFKSQDTRRRELADLFAREREIADARRVVEELQRNVDQGCSTGCIYETALDPKEKHYFDDDYYR